MQKKTPIFQLDRSLWPSSCPSCNLVEYHPEYVQTHPDKCAQYCSDCGKPRTEKAWAKLEEIIAGCSDKTKALYRAALQKWGIWKQTTVVFEKMSELQKELCKNLRGADNVDHIAEEIADVTIMLEQMMEFHDCADAVKRWKRYKLERLEQRIGGNDETN